MQKNTALFIIRYASNVVDTCNVTGCILNVIQNFKHKCLERYFVKGTKSGVQTSHINRLRLILGRLHASTSPKDMDLRGLYLHQLKGKSRGCWSVRVSGNWLITFKFDGPDAIDVNYQVYH